MDRLAKEVADALRDLPTGLDQGAGREGPDRRGVLHRRPTRGVRAPHPRRGLGAGRRVRGQGRVGPDGRPAPAARHAGSDRRGQRRRGRHRPQGRPAGPQHGGPHRHPRAAAPPRGHPRLGDREPGRDRVGPPGRRHPRPDGRVLLGQPGQRGPQGHGPEGQARRLPPQGTPRLPQRPRTDRWAPGGPHRPRPRTRPARQSCLRAVRHRRVDRRAPGPRDGRPRPSQPGPGGHYPAKAVTVSGLARLLAHRAYVGDRRMGRRRVRGRPRAARRSGHLRQGPRAARPPGPCAARASAGTTTT